MSISASRERPSALLPIMSMLFGFTVLAFLYGAAVVRYKVFPYNQLREAKQAAQSLWEIFYVSDETWTELSARSINGGVTIRLTGRYQPGYNFITGCKQRKCGAWLMNDEGRTIHQWQIQFSEVWPQAPHIVHQAADQRVAIHGAHLFPNGDIVFNFEGGSFPFGGGTVLLDKDSRVKWKLEKNTHHDLDVLPNGEMYIIGHVLRFEADPRFPKLRAPYYEEVIYLVGPDGRVLGVTSILEAIAKSPFAGLLALPDESWGESADPLHSNNVEVLRTEYARAFPMFMPGDILVSLLEINTIGVIDGRSGILKWALTGMFVAQHDPDFLPTGNILLFDNRGGDSKKGGSRVIEIDPNTNRITWKYEGLEDHVFDSDVRGKQTRLENGNTLIVEAQGGRVFEIDKKGDIVWEYINGTPDEDGIVRTVGVLTQAERVPYDYVTFLQ